MQTYLFNNNTAHITLVSGSFNNCLKVFAG